MTASGASIVRRAKAAAAAGRAIAIEELAGGDSESITGEVVAHAAADGDGFALVMEEAASYLAMGVLRAFRAYDPERFVIAGGVAAVGNVLSLRCVVRWTTRPAAGYRHTQTELFLLLSVGKRAFWAPSLSR